MFVKKLFGRFFLPSLFSSLALAVGAVADSLYVGRSVGEDGLFVLGAAYPIYMVFSTLSIGMASGGAVHFAAALGEGKEKKARRRLRSTRGMRRAHARLRASSCRQNPSAEEASAPPFSAASPPMA